MSKEEFVTILSDKGYNAGFSNNGIPTVFVNDSLDIKKVNKSIIELIREKGYSQSYGISLVPKIE